MNDKDTIYVIKGAIFISAVSGLNFGIWQKNLFAGFFCFTTVLLFSIAMMSKKL